MRKNILILLLFFYMLGGCAQKPTQIDQPIFDLNNMPKLGSSIATIPLTEALFTQLTQSDISIIRPILTYGYISEVYNLLIDSDVDMIFVSEPSDEILAYAQEQGVELEFFPIAGEAMIFYVHKGNPVNSLTINQIQDIYSGLINNWNQVGGVDSPILAYQYSEGTKTQTDFVRWVMNDRTIIKPPVEWQERWMEDLFEVVLSYQNQPRALGYGYYYYFHQAKGLDEVKVLAIDQILPTNQTIMTKEYPLSTAYYAVIRKDEVEDSDVRMIIAWLLSKDGQAFIEENGYVKIN